MGLICLAATPFIGGLSAFEIPIFLALVWLVWLGVQKAMVSRARRPQLSSPPPRLVTLPVSVFPKLSPTDEMLATLSAEEASQHTRFRGHLERLRGMVGQVEDLVTRKQSADGLERLGWMHLKLLMAKHQLLKTVTISRSDALEAQVIELRRELRDGVMTEEARASRNALLGLTEERLRNGKRLEERKDEIETTLARIEAQVHLGLERAALDSGAAQISVPLDLATRMVEEADFFGASGPLVREMDKKYGTSLDLREMG